MNADTYSDVLTMLSVGYVVFLIIIGVILR